PGLVCSCPFGAGTRAVSDPVARLRHQAETLLAPRGREERWIERHVRKREPSPAAKHAGRKTAAPASGPRGPIPRRSPRSESSDRAQLVLGAVPVPSSDFRCFWPALETW